MSQTKAQLVSGSTAQDLTVDNINTTSINSGQFANRNKIINGAMQVAQRGTSFTPSGTEQPYTLDRFQHVGTSGIDFDTTDTQSTDHPDGFSFSMKLTPDSTDTPTGSANAAIQHRIEGHDMQDLVYGASSAKKVTLSFYAKSSSQNNGHQYGVELAHYATDGTRRLINSSFTITSSWQRFTFTFDGDTTHDVANANTRGFDVNIHLASGADDIATHTSWTTGSLFRTPTGQSNFLDNTSNEFYITGIQLEVGSTATDFEHRAFGDELNRCFRYYEQFNSNGQSEAVFASGYFESTGQGRYCLLYNKKRAAPTITASAPGSFMNLNTNSVPAATSITIKKPTETGAEFQLVSSVGVDGQSCILASLEASTEATIKISSDL